MTRPCCAGYPHTRAGRALAGPGRVGFRHGRETVRQTARGATLREFTVPPAVTVPDTANLTDPVWDNAEVAGAQPQFARRGPDGEWQDVSCAQFRDDVVALARGFVAAGIEPGARVGLMSKTRYEWTVVDY